MFTKIPTVVRASELRKNFAHFMRESAKNPVVISTDRGGDMRVLLTCDMYNALISAYEDALDRQTLEACVHEDDGTRTPIATLLKTYDV